MSSNKTPRELAITVLLEATDPEYSPPTDKALFAARAILELVTLTESFAYRDAADAEQRAVLDAKAKAADIESQVEAFRASLSTPTPEALVAKALEESRREPS